MPSPESQGLLAQDAWKPPSSKPHRPDAEAPSHPTPSGSGSPHHPHYDDPADDDDDTSTFAPGSFDEAKGSSGWGWPGSRRRSSLLKPPGTSFRTPASHPHEDAPYPPGPSSSQHPPKQPRPMGPHPSRTDVVPYKPGAQPRTEEAGSRTASIEGDVPGDVEDAGSDEEDGDEDVRNAVRAVNECVARIGMGPYQWKLFFLCGFGWLADNMWLQGISVAIPGMQRDFDVPDAWMGLGTSSAFIGMMIGAAFWGPVSDAIGRRPAFTMTLLITAAFGAAASFASSFPWYCAMLLGMGTGIGGNLPVDANAFFLNPTSSPASHQNLLTLLSLFWPAGQLVASTLAWILIPNNQCEPFPAPCHDPLTTNRGWRRLLLSLSIITFAMLVGRTLLFRMLESPKFLVARGRAREARNILRQLAVENGVKIEVDVGGAAERLLVAAAAAPASPGGSEVDQGDVTDVDDDGDPRRAGSRTPSPGRNVGAARAPSSSSDSTAQQPPRGGAPAAARSTLLPTLEELGWHPEDDTDSDAGANDVAAGPRTSLLERAPCPPSSRWWGWVRGSKGARRRVGQWTSVAGSEVESSGAPKKSTYAKLRRKFGMLFEGDLGRTTILVWIIWSLISCGYTMFNGFLAKFLGNGSDRTTPPTPDETFRDIFIVSIFGIPGSVIGMILIETRLGRRGTMALSSFGTALSLFLFTLSTSSRDQLMASCLAAVLQNIMYGVLYCYTPEVFDSQVRGTATGVASSLSRVFGTMAPVLTGTLLTLSPSLPLYVASFLIFLSAVCMVLLPIETRGRQAL
ncbi:hypothetical protein HDU96_010234 [Phlyctochytrium bullatum]|nr:hypothetical protein HDU96_010234 [Phlyctochytrium bullatum]